MFSKICLIVYALCLIAFTGNLLFGAGISDFTQWLSGFAVGVSFIKVSDFILSKKQVFKNA